MQSRHNWEGEGGRRLNTLRKHHEDLTLSDSCREAGSWQRAEDG